MIDRYQEFFNSIVVFDTETTSKDFKVAEVVEFGVATYPFNKENSAFFLYRPASDVIDPEVSAVNNITMNMVRDKPLFHEQREDIEMLLSKFSAAVAHNSFYDLKVLETYKVKTPPVICTFRLAKKLFGNDTTVTQYNLAYLRYRFHLPIQDGFVAHRASDDSILTGMLLEFLVQTMQASGILNDDTPWVDQIVKYMAQPVRIYTMPFGKHRGQPLSEVPVSYWNWAFDNIPSLNENLPEFDRDLMYSIEEALNAKLGGGK